MAKKKSGKVTGNRSRNSLFNLPDIKLLTHLTCLD